MVCERSSVPRDIRTRIDVCDTTSSEGESIAKLLSRLGVSEGNFV